MKGDTKFVVGVFVSIIIFIIIFGGVLYLFGQSLAASPRYTAKKSTTTPAAQQLHFQIQIEEYKPRSKKPHPPPTKSCHDSKLTFQKAVAEHISDSNLIQQMFDEMKKACQL